MQDITVKQAEISELDHLSMLMDTYRQFYGRESNIALAREFLLNRFSHGESVIFIAYINKKPVGFTQLYPSFSSLSLARTYILNDLFVVADARKNSVGSQLIESATNYAKLAGAIKLTLSTSLTNKAAQSLYESKGWKKDEQFLVYNFSVE